jgi:hypothetical protein
MTLKYNYVFVIDYPDYEEPPNFNENIPNFGNANVKFERDDLNGARRPAPVVNDYDDDDEEDPDEF